MAHFGRQQTEWFVLIDYLRDQIPSVFCEAGNFVGDIVSTCPQGIGGANSFVSVVLVEQPVEWCVAKVSIPNFVTSE